MTQTPTNPQPVDELLYKYAPDITDVQHIKLRQAIQAECNRARIDEIKRPRKYSKSVVVPDGYNDGYWDAHNQVGKADEIRVLELEAELQQLMKGRE